MKFGVPGAALSDDMHIMADLGADSLAEVELVIALEQSFDVDIPDEDIGEVRTVGDMVRHVADAVRCR
jgi:acyl carrier protein